MSVEEDTQLDQTGSTQEIHREKTIDELQEYEEKEEESYYNSSLFQNKIDPKETQLINNKNGQNYENLQNLEQDEKNHSHNVYSQDTQILQNQNQDQNIINLNSQESISMEIVDNSSTQNLNHKVNDLNYLQENEVEVDLDEFNNNSYLNKTTQQTQPTQQLQPTQPNQQLQPTQADYPLNLSSLSPKLDASSPKKRNIPIITTRHYSNLPDTQIIENNNLVSTKLNYHSLPDTQIILPSNKKRIELSDTQIIPKGPFSKQCQINNELQSIKDHKDNSLNNEISNVNDTIEDIDDTTNQSDKKSDKKSQPTNSIHELPPTQMDLPDTQIINNKSPKNSPTLKNLSISENINPFLDSTNKQTTPKNDLFDFKNLHSHRQVINTQEEPDTSLFQNKTKGTIEVQTDDEKDISHEIDEEDEKEEVDEEEEEGEETEIPINTEMRDHYEDSIITYKKRILSYSPFKLKRSKTSNEKDEELNYNNTTKIKSFFNRPELLKTPGTQIRNYSEPLIFASPFDNFQSSSSPSKKIEKLNNDNVSVADQSIRTEEDNTTMEVDVQYHDDNNGHDNNGTTNNDIIDDIVEEEVGEVLNTDEGQSMTLKIKNNARQQTPPSSPSRMTQELSEDDEDTHIEDAKDDEEEEDKTISEAPIIARRRRRNNIIESQSNGEDTTFINEEENSQNEVISGILREEKSDVILTTDIINQESVWVNYNLKMYTGYIITKYSDNSIINFYEESSTIKNEDLNYLDIRIGDTLNIKTKKFKCIVVGLSKEITTNNIDNDIKCIRGYNMVHLKRKLKGKSKKIEDKEFVIPLSQCWMELEDWMIHQQKFQIIENSKNSSQTVQASTQTSNNPTKSIFLPSTPKKISRHSSNPNDFFPKSLTPSPKKSKKIVSSIFAGFLFCITNINDQRKEELRIKIESNGGTYLDCDLFEIFQYCNHQNNGLFLKPLNFITNDLKFGCLLSSNYCRSSKYLQTLSLNWPILSDKYIDDVLVNNKLLNNWKIYVLPSGFSKHLNCITSMNLYKFYENFMKGYGLIDQLKLNSNLLKDYNILNLNISTTYKTNSKFETCKFIFHAFGVNSLTNLLVNENHLELKSKIQEINHNNKKILVYDSGNLKFNLVDYLIEIFNDESHRKTRKSKRSTSKDLKIDIYIIDWEWVVQCVISGFIWEPNQKITVSC
ncbi:RAD9 [Candida jiufengensis]|uniref:RAD9 n=1 Tax=Candida jiufengensis TaxID=497108 RepID=UPI0022253682|nr:RAD9 [Candida jiufengensis]KAI5956255.1 RAD9 [Candida jiufengensis]